MPRNITSSSQLQPYLNSAKLLVLDFYADWCGPCRQIAPVIDELSRRYSNVNFVKVNVDNSDELTAKFKVKSMPTFVFIKNGRVVGTVSGANQQQIIQMLTMYA